MRIPDNFQGRIGVYCSSLLRKFLHIAICFFILRESNGQIEFVENRGQWPSYVSCRAQLSSGSLWMESDALLFNLVDPQVHAMFHPGSADIPNDHLLRSHAYRLKFEGASAAVFSGEKSASHYYNYYLGNDNNWATGCKAYARALGSGLYDQIDILIYSTSSALKYDFILHPGADPDDIRMVVEGATMQLTEELGKADLHIQTSLHTVIEKAPFAYQLIDGKLVEVKCVYKLRNGVLSYDVGRYNHNYDLIIDPEIAFSTYIGSPASNFGFTACDDSQSNLISGAAVFADDYPTTTGAYSADFNSAAGNYMDVALSKFSSDGSQLLYSTYIGGSGQETPHSVVADSQDNFIVMGVTGSSDFPTTSGAYQQNFLGGPFLSMSDFFTSFHDDGTDIFVAKFSSSGILSASTFIGGNANDGLNYADQLFYNYGDAFRGEVNIDASDRIYVATVTSSPDFPIVAGAPQSAYGGGDTDGVFFRLNASLTNLEWSTYVGGSNDDAAYAIEFRNDGNVLLAGGTKSSNFPFVTPAGEDASHNGQTDGFITMLNGNNMNVIAGTFVGTSEYDQVYFVQTDAADNIYAYGQTEGNMPITPGLYGQANSGQFVRKYGAALNTLEWNTTIGTGSGEIDISPTAFLVSDCEQIYISGWGGNVNSNFCANHPCYATSSTTDGLPVSADAFQSSTDGSDFYLCVLTPDAAALLYASYLGGNESAEHVDGGTSRFDKNGSVFQAVCAGCQNNDDFPTTPGVYSNTNESMGCNIAVFRFDLSPVLAHVDIDGPDQVCAGTEVSFVNGSIGATSYEWDFGDGETSTAFQPTHTFSDSGTYTIRLVGLDGSLCVVSDTAFVTITILPGVDPDVEDPGILCQGESVELQASGSDNLHWLPNASLSATDIPNPIADPVVTTTYFVVDENECEAETLSVVVEVSIVQASASDDVSICIGESTQLLAEGGVSYAWNPSIGLDNASVADPIASPLSTTDYVVTITNADGCSEDETVQVTVFNTAPGGEVYDDINICEGYFAQLDANDGTGWLWSPASSLNYDNVQNPIANPADTTMYTVLVYNACGQGYDYVTVNVLHPDVHVSEGATICAGDSVEAHAWGAQTYLWQPAYYAFPHNEDSTFLVPPESMWITVTGIDENNCLDTDSLYIYVHPSAQVDAGPDQYFVYPDSVYLLGNAFNFDFYWWPSEGLSCTDCIYPQASPSQETWYHLSILDHNGCVTEDSVFVKPYFPVWVPNCITPDNDGINDVFRAYGIGIEGFHLMIFDRWGILVFESWDIDEVWTGGRSENYYVPNDVYDWVIEFDSIDRRTTLKGHVTVAR